MKTFLLSMSILVSITKVYGQETISDSSYSYLGQTKPGNTPKIFQLSYSSGFFAAERIAFSPDGKEVYYSELDSYFHLARIKCYKYSNGKWNGPKTLFENFFSPAISVDGNKLYFQSVSNPGHEIWYSVKSDTNWSVPSKFLSNLPLDYQVQETNSGNIYCSSFSAQGGLGLRDWSKLIINGTDTIIKSLGAPVSTSGDDVDCSVSRDESFIVTAKQSYGLGISFLKQDGTYTNPKKIIAYSGWAPCIIADNKYLFYTNGSGGPGGTFIYWVKVDKAIDSLKNLSMMTNVLEPNFKQNVKIFPNPTTGHISLIYGSAQTQKVLLEIYNTEGKQVISKTLFNSTNTTIDLTGNSKGIYMVKVIADGISYQEKILRE